MAHELNASICAPLSENAEEMSDTAAGIMAAWSKFLKEISMEGLRASLSINETRAKPATGGTRAPRRTREQIAADKEKGGTTVSGELVK